MSDSKAINDNMSANESSTHKHNQFPPADSRFLVFENTMFFKRKSIDNVDELKKYIGSLLPEVITVLELSQHLFDEADVDAVVNQVMVDIFFDEYLKVATPIDLKEYAKELCSLLYPFTDTNDTTKADSETYINDQKQNTIITTISNFASEHTDSIFSKDYWQLQVFDPDFDNKMQLKLVWDFCYINSFMLTGKQYRRTLHKKNGNNTYAEIRKDICSYDDFISKTVFNDYNATSENQFENLIRYYNIEYYKRIDYFLSVASLIQELKNYKVDDKYYNYKSLVASIEQLQDFDMSKIQRILCRDFRDSFVINTQNDTTNMAFYSRYSRPIMKLEYRVIEKIINAKLDLLDFYADYLIEELWKYEKQLLDSSNQDTISLEKYLNDFLSNHFIEKRVVSANDISPFLGNAINTYAEKYTSYVQLTDKNIADMLCQQYNELFTSFFESLEEKYIEELSMYQNLRAELYAWFLYYAEFSCNNYDAITDFLLNEYGIMNFHDQNFNYYNTFIESKPTSTSQKNVLGLFLELINSYIW